MILSHFFNLWRVYTIMMLAQLFSSCGASVLLWVWLSFIRFWIEPVLFWLQFNFFALAGILYCCFFSYLRLICTTLVWLFTRLCKTYTIAIFAIVFHACFRPVPVWIMVILILFFSTAAGFTYPYQIWKSSPVKKSSLPMKMLYKQTHETTFK